MRRLAPVVAALAGAALLVRLSLWQWERASTRGSLLNYTYAAEWLLLAVLLVVGVVVRQHRGPRSRPDDPSRDTAGQVIGPPLAAGEELGEVTRERVRRWLRRAAGRS